LLGRELCKNSEPLMELDYISPEDLSIEQTHLRNLILINSTLFGEFTESEDPEPEDLSSFLSW
jgi:hypothetical protein